MLTKTITIIISLSLMLAANCQAQCVGPNCRVNQNRVRIFQPQNRVYYSQPQVIYSQPQVIYSEEIIYSQPQDAVYVQPQNVRPVYSQGYNHQAVENALNNSTVGPLSNAEMINFMRYARQSHISWRNSGLGSANFHDNWVRIYDQAILKLN